MDSAKVIKLVEADGWFKVRAAGSHHHFKDATKSGLVTVPHPLIDARIKELDDWRGTTEALTSECP